MGEEKRISVIVPVYNAEKTLRACVASILAQSLPAYEVILIDDGSTDGSGAVLDALQAARGDGVLQVRHTANGGVSRARNLGMELARGEFIMFVDADDIITPDCIRTLVSHQTRTGAEMIDMTDRIVGEAPVSGNFYIENAIFNRDTHIWGKLFSKTALEGISFPEGLSIGEDMLFLLAFALSAGTRETICCIPEKGYLYTNNAEGAMNRQFTESFLDQIYCWQRAEELLAGRERALSPYLYTALATNQIISAMLVLGKLARLPENAPADGALREKTIRLCDRTIRRAVKKNGAYAALPMDYKLKVRLFLFSSEQYLRLYGRWKSG